MGKRIKPKFPANPTFSPVDYEAWNGGYSPPAEHRIIDSLIYEPNWRVAAQSEWEGNAFVLLSKGQPFDDDISLELLDMHLSRMKKRKAAIAAGKFLVSLSSDGSDTPKDAD